MPQPPQLLASVVVLMQAPPHAELPVGQTQAPATHEAPDGQTVPQPPQLVMLVFVSTQDEPHWVSDPQPAVEQIPDAQT